MGKPKIIPRHRRYPSIMIKKLRSIMKSMHRGKQWFLHLAKSFGYEALFLIFLVYFTQGIRSTLTSLATSYYLKETLHLTPSEAESVRAAAGLPWIVKPLYGMISDILPIYGEH